MQTELSFDFPDPAVSEAAAQPIKFMRKQESAIERAKRRVGELMDKGLKLILAYSAGKDSSSLAGISLAVAAERSKQGAPVPGIVVVHSETGVEQPEIELLAREEMAKMAVYAKARGFKLETRIGRPTQNASFGVRIIGGRALPSFPDNRADCTTNWKIDVNTKLIADVTAAAKHKEGLQPVICTGVRQDESASRDIKIAKRGEVAEGTWTNDLGDLRASPILDWTSDDVWLYIGLSNAGEEDSFSDFAEVMRIYRDAGGSSCVVVADMKSTGNSKPCGTRTGCWSCLRVSEDKSMVQMIESDPERYGYLKPLSRLRDYMSRSQYDWSLRQYVGRTIAEDGHIEIGADTYSPEMLQNLFVYTLSAQILSGVHILDISDVIAIDARWSLYGLTPPFTALKLYNEVVGGRVQEAPVIARFPKTPVPRIGRIHVGNEWDSQFARNSPMGLRNVALELHGEACGLSMKQLTNGNLVTDFEDELLTAVDMEGAEDFMTFIADEKIEQECRADNPDWASGYLTYLQYGLLGIAKGKSRQVDEILRRTRWRQLHNLHGQRSVEELRARCDVVFEYQMDLLQAA